MYSIYPRLVYLYLKSKDLGFKANKVVFDEVNITASTIF